MKNSIILIAISAISFVACNNSAQKNDEENKLKHDSLTSKNEIKKIDSATLNNNAIFPMQDIVSGYIELKNALTNDNGKDAAVAGNNLLGTLNKINTATLNVGQQKMYASLKDDLKENAEHIGANAGKIEHQREHFEMLSKDVMDLVKTFGNGGHTLYEDFCPMANNGKGATWLSELKEIKNPYMGSKMPGCGSIKEEIK